MIQINKKSYIIGRRHRNMLVTLMLAAGFCVTGCSDDDEYDLAYPNEKPSYENGGYVPGNAQGLASDAIQLIIADPASAMVVTPPDLLNEDRPAWLMIDGKIGNGPDAYQSAETPSPIEHTIVIDLPDGFGTVDFLRYYARKAANNGYVLKMSVLFSTKDAPDNFKNKLDLTFPQKANFTQDIPVPASCRETLKKVKLVIPPDGTMKSGTGYLVSIVDLEFWQNGPMVDIPEFFTDQSCTEVKAGTTQADVDAVKSSFFRAIAQSVLNGTYDDRRVCVPVYSPAPEEVASVNKTLAYGRYNNVTGIYVAKGSDIVALCEGAGGNVSIVVEPHATGGAGVQEFALKDGINTFQAENDGLIYLVNNKEGWNGAKVNIATGAVNGYFDMYAHKGELWNLFLPLSLANKFDVLGKYSHLVFNPSDLLRNVVNPKMMVDNCDTIIAVQQRVLGLQKNVNRMMIANRAATTMQYKLNCVEVPAAFVDDFTAMADKNAFFNVATAVGWNNLVTYQYVAANMGFAKLYAMMTQIEMNKTPYLTENPELYDEAFNTIFVKKTTFAAVANKDVTLVSLWQLELFAKLIGVEDFQTKFRDAMFSRGAAVGNNYFVGYACRATGYGLKDYFMAWQHGALADGTIKTAIGGTAANQNQIFNNKPTVRMEYLSDKHFELFKNPQAIVEGHVARDGDTFTMSGWQNVVAFEVYVDNKLAYISINDTFSCELAEGVVKVKAIPAGKAEAVVEIVL